MMLRRYFFVHGVERSKDYRRIRPLMREARKIVLRADPGSIQFRVTVWYERSRHAFLEEAFEEVQRWLKHPDLDSNGRCVIDLDVYDDNGWRDWNRSDSLRFVVASFAP